MKRRVTLEVITAQLDGKLTYNKDREWFEFCSYFLKNLRVGITPHLDTKYDKASGPTLSNAAGNFIKEVSSRLEVATAHFRAERMRYKADLMRLNQLHSMETGPLPEFWEWVIKYGDMRNELDHNEGKWFCCGCHDKELYMLAAKAKENIKKSIDQRIDHIDNNINLLTKHLNDTLNVKVVP